MAGKLTESDEADLEEELASLIEETPTLELPEVPRTWPTIEEEREVEDRRQGPAPLAT